MEENTVAPVQEKSDSYHSISAKVVEENIYARSMKVSSPLKKNPEKKEKKSSGVHRKNIKSKYDTVDDLNPEALSAQTDEAERIRRLELQRSIIQSLSKNPQLKKLGKAGSSEVVDLTIGDELDEDETVTIIDDDFDEDTPPVKKPCLSKYDVMENCEDHKILVNVKHPANEKDIFLSPQIARAIKPHQVGGIRFMYDNIIESLRRYSLSEGFGCILADAMGLGKTLQVISFIDVFMKHTEAKHVLVVVPVNTLQNWQAEFNRWLPPNGSGEVDNEVHVSPRNFTLFILSETSRSMDARYEVICNWYGIGGVLLIGYEMYRLLCLSVPSIGGNKMAVMKKKGKRSQLNSCCTTIIDLDENEKEMNNLIKVQMALCNPGPDLVICDEGHRIKNESSNISQALKKLRTKRRIVLTGYPLQNNLLEYWCMVDFVRPKYLGSKQEFLDLFERPITNGQCVDSTEADIRLMKYRSHVLHKLLAGFVLRRGHEILRSVLPPKFEHVILVRSSHVQSVLYNMNIFHPESGHECGTIAAAIGPLKAFAVCSKIWNHPDIYYDQAMQQEYQSALNLLNDAEFTGTSSFSESSCKLEWPASLQGYKANVLENSPKMMILMAILEKSVAHGDRMLIFSQSLPTLSFIEKALSNVLMPIPYSADTEGNFQMSNKKWIKGKNYFRLDGSTSSSERDHLVNEFNSSNNYSCWVFLLSTRAGCLGINLTGANRVIVVDVSFNPCYDAQAVCRVYRYGQTKPSYIYRLVTDGSMEKRMYDRQISKQGMADRVVDELNPERHFAASDITTLLSPLDPVPSPVDMSEHVKEYLFDPVLMQILKKHGKWLTKLPFKHESLLIDSQTDKLTEVEKYVAMKGFHQQLSAMRYYSQQLILCKDSKMLGNHSQQQRVRFDAQLENQIGEISSVSNSSKFNQLHLLLPKSARLACTGQDLSSTTITLTSVTSGSSSRVICIDSGESESENTEELVPVLPTTHWSNHHLPFDDLNVTPTCTSITTVPVATATPLLFQSHPIQSEVAPANTLSGFQKMIDKNAYGHEGMTCMTASHSSVVTTATVSSTYTSTGLLFSNNQSFVHPFLNSVSSQSDYQNN